MINELKSGDKLICVEPTEGIILGQEYTFKSYYCDDDDDCLEKYRLINIFENNYQYFQVRFNKIDNKEEEKFIIKGYGSVFNSVDDCIAYASHNVVLKAEIYKKFANINSNVNYVVEKV